MTAAGNRDRILEALRLSSRPLDDDQLSERSGVRPRQQVNQICRALHTAGVLRRWSGPDGKIVNELVGPGQAGGGSVVVRPEEGELPPERSPGQRDAERLMLDALGAELGLRLDPLRITGESGWWLEIGCDKARTVLVECWAHQGPPDSAQRHKVLADALKLTWIAGIIHPRPFLILCMSDLAAAAPFLPISRSWVAQALQDLMISVQVVTLPEETRRTIRAAQAKSADAQ